MTASPPPGSEGQLERLLQALGRAGERIQSVIAAAFPQAGNSSFLSGTDEQLTESGTLGQGQRGVTEISRAEVGESDATPNTEFPLDVVDWIIATQLTRQQWNGFGQIFSVSNGRTG